MDPTCTRTQARKLQICFAPGGFALCCPYTLLGGWAAYRPLTWRGETVPATLSYSPAT